MSTARPLFQPDPPPERRPRRFSSSNRGPRGRWARVLGWIGTVFILLNVALAIGVVVALKSTAVHNYVLAKAQSIASEQLGAHVQLQNFRLNLSHLTLDVYGVTIHGANPHSEVPLLQLQHAEVGIGIVSLLHKNWYVSSLRIDHPVVQILIDRDGNSNLPKPRSSNKTSNTSIFDLGVRHAILDQGEVYFNAQKSALSADLHDLEFLAGFTPGVKMYSGTLSYTNGKVLFGDYKPFQHNFDAQFDLTPFTFQLHRASITSPAAKVNLVATVSNLDAPIVDAQYQIDVDGAQVATLINNASIPAGLVRTSGKVHYQQVANQPALNSLQLAGDFTSRRLLVHTPSLQTAVDDLAAHYSLANGDAVIHDFRASMLGGEITAQGTMKQLAGDSHSELTANLRNISLGDAIHLASSRTAQPVSLTGTLNGDAKASWGKTMTDLVAQANVSIHGAAQGTRVASNLLPEGATSGSASRGAPVPLDSEIHAAFNGARQEVALTRSYVHLPQTSLDLNGTVSTHSSLTVRLQANDLAELARIATMFSEPKEGQAAHPLQLSGQANFQGNVQGSTSAPHITGQLSASNLRVNGSNWRVFRTNVDASPSGASLHNADLEPASGGRITFNAGTDLRKWAFTNSSPIQLELDASQLNIGDLLNLSGQQLPVTGILNTHLSAHGTELNPIGNGTLSVTKLVAYDEPINSVQATFNGTGNETHANLAIQMHAGSIRSVVSVRPKDKTYTAQVTSSGIDLAKVAALKARNLDASGVVALRANGQGSFSNPQLTASVQIPSLVIRKQEIRNVILNLDMANRVANATLASAAMNTSLQARARVNLTGDYDTDASLDTRGIPLQPLVAIYWPAQAASLSGETELHATLRGPIKNQKALEAHVTIPYLRVGYNNIQLASAGPLHADYQNGIVQIQRGAIRGTDTNLEFEGSIPTFDRSAPMSLVLHGDINLQLAQLFDPDIRSSGQLRFNINSRGSAGRDIGGEIDIVDAGYASGDLPVGLQHGNGVLTLTTDRINIESFQGTVGSGTVTASGGIAYRPALQFDLGLAAKGIKMLYPQGMRETVDANIHLAGTTDNATLGGTVNIADISFTPAFELGSFVGQLSSDVQAPPSQGIAQNINLNLAVHSTNNVSLISRTVSLNGSANLQVRGTAANPVILGRVNLTGGDFVMNNDRFVLTGGAIQFVNPSQTQPVINLNVTTTIQQYNLGLRITGPSDHMNIQYTSDPALPQADILNLLAFGTTTGAAAGQVASDQPSPPATQQAESLIASQVTSQISSRVAKVAGISQLSISPVLGNQSNNGNAGANITIQQRVTGNLFVTFSTNTASTQSQTIQGQYKLSPRVSISATRDPNGGFAVDTLIKKSW